jgi:hypothetical protein
MSHPFKASRLIGLLAVALGLMAFSATAAQAEPLAYWEVEGTKIEGTSTLLPTVQAKNDTTHSTLLTKVNGQPINVLCGPIKFVGAKLHTLGRATGKIHYEGCTIEFDHVLATRCKPHSPGAAAGLIETGALEGLSKLHSSGTIDLVKLSPVTGLTFVTLELGALCAVAERVDITGHVYLKECSNEGLVNKVEHLFEEGPLTELFFWGNPATIDGSAWGFLEGAHVGMKFSGHPN